MKWAATCTLLMILYDCSREARRKHGAAALINSRQARYPPHTTDKIEISRDARWHNLVQPIS